MLSVLRSVALIRCLMPSLGSTAAENQTSWMESALCSESPISRRSYSLLRQWYSVICIKWDIAEKFTVCFQMMVCEVFTLLFQSLPYQDKQTVSKWHIYIWKSILFFDIIMSVLSTENYWNYYLRHWSTYATTLHCQPFDCITVVPKCTGALFHFLAVPTNVDQYPIFSYAGLPAEVCQPLDCIVICRIVSTNHHPASSKFEQQHEITTSQNFTYAISRRVCVTSNVTHE